MMDCNKDEAIRAKELAQKKMQNSDFDGARKMAMKAQQLFPHLENISQLLAVCNVHSAAQSRISGSEKDWYSILQLEGIADEVIIKKQYRKLALVLHPDKNQFPGAEAAFKLIGEANLVLSDSGKKAIYDKKILGSSRSVQAKNPVNQGNEIPPTGKQNGVNKSKQDAYFAQFTVRNYQKRAEFNATSTQQASWTCCPFCNVNFPYHRNNVGMTVTCQSCSRDFPANDIGVPLGSTHQTRATSQDVPSKFNNQPQSSNHMNPCRYNSQHQDTSQAMPATSKGSQPAVSSEMGKTTEKVTGFQPLNTRDHANLGGASSMAGGTDGVELPNVDHRRPAENSGNNRRKRQRQMDTKSSESFDTSSSSDLQEIIRDEIKSNVTAEQDHGVNSFHQPRRSSRRKHDISEQDGGPQGVDVISDSDSESFSDSDEDTKTYHCPDPEFNNFDKDREESCFDVGQFWACYDKEGMPRYYAKIKEVCSNPFKVKITWLEHQPDDAFARSWSKRFLPVSCGKYKYGDVNTQDRFAFSHRIDYAIVRKKGSFMVYPKIGETWALFKNWSTDWVHKRRSPKKYAYDFVEVLSEFTEDAGIQVVFLEKEIGFRSLFCHNKSSSPMSILPNEVLKFSHRVPSFKMNGNERVGVPAGSFELDTACLPIEQVADAKDPYDSTVPENRATPKKSGEFLSKSCSGGETLGLRKSPRGLSTRGKVNGTSC